MENKISLEFGLKTASTVENLHWYNIKIAFDRPLVIVFKCENIEGFREAVFNGPLRDEYYSGLVNEYYKPVIDAPLLHRYPDTFDYISIEELLALKKTFSYDKELYKTINQIAMRNHFELSHFELALLCDNLQKEYKFKKNK